MEKPTTGRAWAAFRRGRALGDRVAGLLASAAPAIWIDHLGRTWRTPSIVGRLKPGKCPGHAALREFIIQRDGMCQWRGATDNLVADHIISRRNGGAHHPDNLRTLCDPCNCARAGLVGAKREAVA